MTALPELVPAVLDPITKVFAFETKMLKPETVLLDPVPKVFDLATANVKIIKLNHNLVHFFIKELKFHKALTSHALNFYPLFMFFVPFPLATS
jgi:hypothetical protein